MYMRSLFQAFTVSWAGAENLFFLIFRAQITERLEEATIGVFILEMRVRRFVAEESCSFPYCRVFTYPPILEGLNGVNR